LRIINRTGLLNRSLEFKFKRNPEQDGSVRYHMMSRPEGRAGSKKSKGKTCRKITRV
jgi:hypothetical protein